jgi:hypothetical protein
VFARVLDGQTLCPEEGLFERQRERVLNKPKASPQPEKLAFFALALDPFRDGSLAPRA